MSKRLIYHKPVKLACLRVNGPYCTSVPTAWGAMRSWAHDRNLYSKVRRAIGLSLDDPTSTDPRDIRYVACLDFFTNIEQPKRSDRARAVYEHTIPGGVYATFPHHGDHADIGRKFSQIRREWVTNANLAIDTKRPFLEIYDTAGRQTHRSNYEATLAVPVITADCQPIALDEQEPARRS